MIRLSTFPKPGAKTVDNSGFQKITRTKPRQAPQKGQNKPQRKEKAKAWTRHDKRDFL